MNKQVLLKSIGLGLLLTLIPVIIFNQNLFFGTPIKMIVGYSIVILWFVAMTFKNYQRFIWQEKFNYYVKEFHLTIEDLAKISGRSKFEFFEGHGNQILFPTRNQKIRDEILKSLEEKYGGIPIEKKVD